MNEERIFEALEEALKEGGAAARRRAREIGWKGILPALNFRDPAKDMEEIRRRAEELRGKPITSGGVVVSLALRDALLAFADERAAVDLLRGTLRGLADVAAEAAFKALLKELGL